MNNRTKALRLKLLRRYYKSAVLEWFRPKSFHWVKLVDSDGNWKWKRADLGLQGKLLRTPPLHIYQTVLKFKTNNPPRGKKTSGYLLGGPLFFDCDLLSSGNPVSLWRLLESIPKIESLVQILNDKGDYRITHVGFSGSRGFHIFAKRIHNTSKPIILPPNYKDPLWKTMQIERLQIARSIGNWCKNWDWRVTSDVWRVARVPRSIHGTSALRAITVQSPFTMNNVREQLKSATPFSFERKLRIRITRSVPVFVFLDGASYGPYRKGWATKIPIAVALHLIWKGFAKPREKGPQNSGDWFEKGWQILFRANVPKKAMSFAMSMGGGAR